jgi:hypothetical protein
MKQVTWYRLIYSLGTHSKFIKYSISMASVKYTNHKVHTVSSIRKTNRHNGKDSGYTGVQVR